MSQTQNGVLQKDDNGYPVAGGVSSADNSTVLNALIDPNTGRLLVDSAGGGTGTVTSVSVVTANGFAGSVADPTTTPAITLSTTISGILKGDGTAISAASSNSDYAAVAFKTIAVSGQSDVVADSPIDTLTLVGSGITITTDATTDTITFTSGGGGLTVGTTTISSGANTRILYDNSGVLGEYTITGTGTVVAMQTNPTLSGITITDATNIVLDTTTGTKIGTATTQKLGFYNATPIVQPTGDVTTALQNLGLGASLTVAADTVKTANEATDTTCFPLFVTASGTQTLQPKNNTSLTFNSNTASLGATLITATTSVTSASILASSNDSGALGASGTAFADLFLASGGVINWDAGDYTLTHSAGILTANKDFRITSANVGTNADSVPTLSSTSTLTSKTLTSPTIQTTPVIADGTNIILTVPTIDGTATGEITNAFNSGYTSSAVGDLVILDSSATWQKTDANTASIYNGLIGIALEVKASGNALKVLLRGFAYMATAFPTFTIGGAVYMSETAGAVTQTAPTTTGAATRLLGYAVHADKMWFNPSNDWITHT